jgi:hypothetical protein
MSTWNHRIVHYKSSLGDDVYQFAEVFYNDKGEFNGGWSDPFLVGDTPEELQELAQRLVTAAFKPVLEVELDPYGGTGEEIAT